MRSAAGTLWGVSALYRKQANQRTGESSCHITFRSCSPTERTEREKGKAEIERHCSKCSVDKHEDGGVSGVSSSCGARGGFLPSKESTCQYLVSVPGLGRFPGEGNGNLLQYSCLGNPMNRGAWRATVHQFAKSQIQSTGSQRVRHY